MKIGIWLGFDLKESAGGAFSYTDRLIQLIDEHEFPKGIEVCFINLLGLGSFSKEVVGLINLPLSLLKTIRSNQLLYRVLKGLTRRYAARRGLTSMLKKKQIKLMYYIHQGECLDSNFPFIATNWDIGHLSTHAFPEVIWDGKPFEVRDFFYRNILPKALMIFCESQSGKEELMNYTNIGAHKIRILPMFGGAVTDVRLSKEEEEEILTSYGLNEYEYFFYPAQFWAHKNHVGLIKSFAEVIKLHPNLKLVLSGSDKGNKSYVQFLIQEMGIADKVLFLGFVSLESLYTMYKYAAALVMASHFGPTNMPPIEAMEIGCPVVCSDLGGHREILGDAACYFDSYDVKSMTKAMVKVLLNNNQYRKLIAERRVATAFRRDKAISKLDQLILEVKEIRENWA